MRFSLILLNLFWVQELVAREIDRKIILFSLAYPVSRASFLAGRFAAVLILSMLAAIVLGLLLLLAVTMGGGYAQEFAPALGVPFWATVAGFVLDAAVVARFFAVHRCAIDGVGAAAGSGSGFCRRRQSLGCYPFLPVARRRR
jgi:Cu-processing system permease protein